jgi:hypothetical protein
MVIMINRMIYPGSCRIIGMRVDVIMNNIMTENPIKANGKYAPKYSENINSPKDEEDTMTTALLKRTARTHRIDYIYHEDNNQDNHNGGGNDRNRGANGSDKKKHKISSVF